MNGRMYDPLLGRFLSPDPYVPNPFLSQDFNRYAYCRNNPLKYTDPSGESLTLAIITGIAVAATINYGVQVAVNRSMGAEWKDALWGNIDWLDVIVSGVIGGVTAGASSGFTAGTSFGKGLISVGKSNWWKYGSIIGGSAITSFFDWTRNDGFTVKPFEEASTEFVFNMMTAGASQVSGKAAGNLFWSKGQTAFKGFATDITKSLLIDGLPSLLYSSGIDPMVKQNDPTQPNLNIPNQPRSRLIEQNHIQDKSTNKTSSTMVGYLKLNR